MSPVRALKLSAIVPEAVRNSVVEVTFTGWIKEWKVRGLRHEDMEDIVVGSLFEHGLACAKQRVFTCW